MISLWTTISVITLAFIISIVLLLVFLHGHQEDKKVVRSLEIFGFLLIGLQTAMLFTPLPQDLADSVITIRLAMNSLGFLLIGVALFLELKVEDARKYVLPKYAERISEIKKDSSKAKSAPKKRTTKKKGTKTKKK